MPRDGLLLILEDGEDPRFEVSAGPFEIGDATGTGPPGGVSVSWNPELRQLRIRSSLFGTTPVYWHREPGRLVVGSKVRRLYEAGVVRGIDHGPAMAALAALPLGLGRTIFSQISELPPGFVLVADERGVQLEPALPPRREKAVDRSALRERVLAAVDSSLDPGPNYCSLSGGVDSSWLFALAVSTGKEIIPVCIDDGGRSSEERLAAARLCSRLDVVPRVVRLAGVDLPAVLPEAVEACESLLWNGLAVERYLAFRRFHQSEGVLISGAGADELFVGQPAILDRDRRGRPAWRRRLLEDAAVVRSLLSRGCTSAIGRPPRPQGSDPRAFLISHWLPTSTLPAEARAAAACGLLVRFPYLDPAVVAASRSLPLSSLIGSGLGKLPLREAAAMDLPREHAFLAKRGGASPSGGGLRSRRQWLLLYRRWLSADALAGLPFLRPTRVSELLDAFAVLPPGDDRRGAVDRVLMRLTSLSVLKNGLVSGMTRALSLPSAGT